MLNTAYVQSKLANVLFTLGLDKRLKGTNVTVNVLHPGVIKTEIMQDYHLSQVSNDSQNALILALFPCMHAGLIPSFSMLHTEVWYIEEVWG